MVKTSEVPGKLTELIPTLSETDALKVTDAVCEEEVRDIEVLLAVKRLMEGLRVSVLVTTILIDLVDKLPVSSAATRVKVSVVSPKL